MNIIKQIKNFYKKHQCDYSHKFKYTHDLQKRRCERCLYEEKLVKECSYSSEEENGKCISETFKIRSVWRDKIKEN